MEFIDKKKIAEYLKPHIQKLSLKEIVKIIEIPPPEINYTYAVPMFQVAKYEKKSPKLLAKELVKKLILPEYLEKIEPIGPYLNFRIKPPIILNNIYKFKKDYGKIKEIIEKKINHSTNIVIEYPSPNTNKPLHLGHIRNMLIGSSLVNLFKYKGYKVYQVNLNNDRGIHICKSMLAYKMFGQNQEPNIKSDHFVGDFYVKYNIMEEENKNVIEEAQDLLKKWEEKDPDTRALWEKMNQWAIDGFEETYKSLGISFDKQYFESNYYWKGKDIILDGFKKGIFEKTKDGAIIASLKQNYNLPDKILLRSDGTSLYITQDIYLASLKKKDFDYNRSIYIVGSEQDLYFKQLFAVLDMLGFTEDKYHFSYGMIYLPEGKMKSREGKVVDADDLIKEIQNLAKEEVHKRYTEISEKEKSYRAKIIGIAALKFHILKINPKSDIIFNPEESISFEGETGPYILYVYARIESIIQKSEENIDIDINFGLLENEKELNLIRQLNYFPEIVDQTVNNYDIHLIPKYLLNLCQLFNSFYTSCKVIQENKEIERARLLLIFCIQIIIKIGLNLIGIETLDQM